MSLLEKASIITTPTSYENGKILSVKPNTSAGDFDFTRNSSAARVNSQGLIEDMQILSGDLVSNGDFSQIGSEEITNGGFDTDSDWNLGTGWSISGGIATLDGTQVGSSGLVSNTMSVTSGKTYKVVVNVISTSSGFRLYDNNGVVVYGLNVGENVFYRTVTSSTYQVTPLGLSGATGSIDNVSVKEVGQDWTLSADSSIFQGFANVSSTNTYQYILQSGILTVGKKYKVEYTILNGSIGTLKLGTSFGVTPITSTVGTHSIIATALTTDLYIERETICDVNITNIKLIEITSDTNLPRIDYTGGEGHWLFEPQRTNLMTYSDDFSQWNSYQATSNTTISPNGNSVLFLDFEDTRMYSTTSISIGTEYTSSIYLKANKVADVVLRDIRGIDTTITLTTNWERYELTATSAATSTNSLLIDARFSQGLGASGLEIALWGAQIEQGSYATSIIPTNGSTVTRLQDAAFGAGSSDLINSTEGVLYAEIAALANDSYRFLSLSDGSNSNNVRFNLSPIANQISFEVISGGSLQLGYTNNSTDVLSNTKIAIKYKLNDFAVWINGVEVNTDASGITPIGLNTLNFDRGTGGNVFYGKTKCVAVFKEALTDAELTCLTTI